MTVALTELTDIDPERVDGVKNPASGFPILLMKAVAPTTADTGAVDGEVGYSDESMQGCGCCENCTAGGTAKAVNGQGGIDEGPDIAGAERVLVELFRLIGAEAAEGATGAFHEIYDIQCLVEAVSLMCCFRDMEQMGDEDDGDPIAKAIDYVIKRKFTAQRRRELAGEGKALDDGSYPIENAEDLHNAATLARSGHGNVAAAKRLIAKRAKDLGVANPLAHDNTSKDAPVEPEVEAPVVETPADEAVKDAPDVGALVEAAVAKAREDDKAVIEELRADLAKVMATPIPGGPVVTAPDVAVKERRRDELVKELAYCERMVDQSTEQDMKSHYRARAAAAKAALDA